MAKILFLEDEKMITRRLGVHEPADAVGGQHRSGVDQGEERRAPGPAHAALSRLGGDQAGGDREDR